jgi:hypothetical protein
VFGEALPGVKSALGKLELIPREDQVDSRVPVNSASGLVSLKGKRFLRRVDMRRG